MSGAPVITDVPLGVGWTRVIEVVDVDVDQVETARNLDGATSILFRVQEKSGVGALIENKEIIGLQSSPQLILGLVTVTLTPAEYTLANGYEPGTLLWQLAWTDGADPQVYPIKPGSLVVGKILATGP